MSAVGRQGEGIRFRAYPEERKHEDRFALLREILQCVDVARVEPNKEVMAAVTELFGQWTGFAIPPPPRPIGSLKHRDGSKNNSSHGLPSNPSVSQSLHTSHSSSASLKSIYMSSESMAPYSSRPPDNTTISSSMPAGTIEMMPSAAATSVPRDMGMGRHILESGSELAHFKGCLSCNICGKSASMTKNLEIHRSSTAKTAACDDCWETFESAESSKCYFHAVRNQLQDAQSDDALQEKHFWKAIDECFMMKKEEAVEDLQLPSIL